MSLVSGYPVSINATLIISHNKFMKYKTNVNFSSGENGLMLI